MKYFLFHFIGLAVLMIACSGSRTNERIDHIILAVNDLERGMQQFEELTGVKPVVGGKHPDSFTQNALVALEGGAYIEILAPRADADSVPEWIRQFRSITPMGWAVYTENIESTRKKLISMGFPVSDIKPGARTKPDGEILSWSTMEFAEKDIQVFPFFIEWGEDVVHPSASSPTGCSLIKFEIATTDKDMQTLNENFKLGLSTTSGETKLTLRLRTPKGVVTFPAY
ncbi:MAG: VOC family protein [Cyclobacteriaceae bacterium]|nr:VOC family protein [Cyclobacteriaceae bacterium]